MKKRITCLMLCLALVAGLTVPAFAADTPDTAVLTVNGVEIPTRPAQIFDGTAYVSLSHVTQALRPDAVFTWENDRMFIRAADLTMSAKVGACYMEVNGRCLYVPGGVKRDDNGDTFVPSRSLALALGADVTWENGVVFTTGSGVTLPGADSFYDAEALDLLARVITHESGNQPLDGKIAVGNVILNRVNSPSFPDTVSDVIFEKNQFPNATDATPNAESILAAKLCLEGAMVVPGALYFNGVNKPCWASRNKTLIAVIGGHAFFG